MRIVYHPAAADELFEAAQFYESRQIGLGDKFLDAVEESLDKINNQPLIWRANGESRRKYFVKRFPYVLIYRVEESHIFILAVAHTSRKPGYWEARDL